MSVVAGAIQADAAIVLLYLATGALGTIVAVRVPANAVGWLLVGTGLLAGMQAFAFGYADLALIAERGSASVGLVAAMFSLAVWPLITFTPLIPVLLLFPDGTLLSRRWWAVLWMSVFGLVGTGVGILLLDETYGDLSRWGVDNPLATDAADGWLAVTFMLVIVTLIAAAWSLIVRLRRSEGTERLRIKLVVYGGVMAVPLWIVGGAILDETLTGGILAGVALTLVPASIGAAILRYRLYDIDRLISRTVSYALVAGLLAALYAVIIVGLPQVLPGSSDSPLLVAGATLAAAAVFNPLRRWVQGGVDRRFNRARYDAQREVDDFAALLRDSVELEDVAREVVGVLTRTMQPDTVSIWVKDQ